MLMDYCCISKAGNREINEDCIGIVEGKDCISPCAAMKMGWQSWISPVCLQKEKYQRMQSMNWKPTWHTSSRSMAFDLIPSSHIFREI